MKGEDPVPKNLVAMLMTERGQIVFLTEDEAREFFDQASMKAKTGAIMANALAMAAYRVRGVLAPHAHPVGLSKAETVKALRRGVIMACLGKERWADSEIKRFEGLLRRMSRQKQKEYLASLNIKVRRDGAGFAAGRFVVKIRNVLKGL